MKEYRHIGDICTIKGRIGFRGYTRDDLVGPGEGAITLSPSNIIDDKLNLDKCSYISWFKYEESPEIMIYEGDIIFAKTASIGKVALIEHLPEKATINPQFIVLKDIKCNNHYLYYSLRSRSLKQQVKVITNGVAIPTLSQANFAKLTIPYPSLSEQEHIVAELDLLSDIIEKKKAQLKELDNLAQSIFYDMFGDPITNEKGWVIKTMGDVGTFQRGSGLTKKDLTESGFPCILYGQLHTRFDAFTERHLTCIPEELVRTAKIANTGNVIMALTSEDVEGSCKSTAWLGDYDIAVGSDAAIYRHSLNGIYVSYYTRTKAFFNEKAKYANGFKVTHISTKEIATIPIPVPPIKIQNDFADRIIEIEHQKTAIKKSIEEVQTLFDSRMDYYFN